MFFRACGQTEEQPAVILKISSNMTLFGHCGQMKPDNVGDYKTWKLICACSFHCSQLLHHILEADSLYSPVTIFLVLTLFLNQSLSVSHIPAPYINARGQKFT